MAEQTIAADSAPNSGELLEKVNVPVVAGKEVKALFDVESAVPLDPASKLSVTSRDNVPPRGYGVTVYVYVTASPEAVNVAEVTVFSNAIVPEEEALKTPICTTETGRASDPFAVNVAVSV